jgi:hypothetical protein
MATPTPAAKPLLLAPAPPSSSPSRAATAHLLPCRIHHDGPVALPPRLWQPEGLTPSPPSSSDAAASEPDARQGEGAAAADANGGAEKTAPPPPPPVVHFRGRRLLGAEVRVPAGYRGAALRVVADGGLASSAADGAGALCAPAGGDGEDHDDGDDEDAIPTGATEQVAEFERMVVWRHDVVADRADDRYVRGVEEWIGFATAVSVDFCIHD